MAAGKEFLHECKSPETNEQLMNESDTTQGQLIATTLRQSKMLLRSGIDPATADMRWCVLTRDKDGNRTQGESLVPWLLAGKAPNPTPLAPFRPVFTPAWSVGRLYEIAGRRAMAEAVEASLDLPDTPTLRAYLTAYIILEKEENNYNIQANSYHEE